MHSRIASVIQAMRRFRTGKQTALCLLYCLFYLHLPAASASKAAPLLEFNATYAAQLSGFSVTATRELKTLADGSQELRFSAESWLAKIEEVSQFQWSETGQLIPNNYEYHRTGLGRDRHAVLTFNWQKKRVTNNVQSKPWKMEIPEAALDKLSYQLQLRQDLLAQKPVLSYQVADGGRLKTYHFEVLKEETLDTPVGKLITVKVKKVRASGKKRVTYLWLAKDWNYLLVRLQQKESDGKHYEINLAQAELNGEQVKGF